MFVHAKCGANGRKSRAPNLFRAFVNSPVALGKGWAAFPVKEKLRGHSAGIDCELSNGEGGLNSWCCAIWG